ncbi:hypothetical protein [Hydrogenophaga sp. 5NK40-0174]|uniref:hypothetical protein n=1 Tax=Hydrogenophaga sp. 5NK40-0174 TaxID=3127649 RepID=UPI00310ADE3A
MGIRFNRKSWRAPLQLIDSLLPQPSQPRPQAVTANRTTLAFARAGWLGRGRARDNPVAPTAGAANGEPKSKPAPCRLATVMGQRVQDAAPSARIALSGRMSDVCAELDRLAALESAGLPQAA